MESTFQFSDAGRTDQGFVGHAGHRSKASDKVVAQVSNLLVVLAALALAISVACVCA